jgi:DNA-binding PadR family transcriptional regulator
MKAEFFILGALHRGDLHPYEIKRRLSNALVECYTDVDVGTLYYAVRQLVRSGDIAQKTRQKVARGGERTIYRITPQGRKRFQELLLDRFQEKGTVAQTIYPALLFLHLAQLPAVAELLRERLRQTESAMSKIRAIKEQFGAVLGSGNCYLVQGANRKSSSAPACRNQAATVALGGCETILLKRRCGGKRDDW